MMSFRLTTRCHAASGRCLSIQVMPIQGLSQRPSHHSSRLCLNALSNLLKTVRWHLHMLHHSCLTRRVAF